MKDDFFADDVIGTVRFRMKEGLPTWSMLYYLEKTCSNYLKLRTIEKICALSARGFHDNQLAIASFSFDILPYQAFDSGRVQPKNIVPYAEKGESPEKFWASIHRLRRPIALYRESTEVSYRALYDYEQEDAARVVYFQEQSPGESILTGILGSLVDLLYAGNREERERNAHCSRELGQAVDNIGKIALASQRIVDPRTPQGVQVYAMQQMATLMAAQERINRGLDVKVLEVKGLKFDNKI